MEFWCVFHRSGARAENRSQHGLGGYRQLQAAEHDNLSATWTLACEAPHGAWLVLGPDARVAARNAWSLTAHQESLMPGEQCPGRVPVRKNVSVIIRSSRNSRQSRLRFLWRRSGPGRRLLVFCHAALASWPKQARSAGWTSLGQRRSCQSSGRCASLSFTLPRRFSRQPQE